MFQNVQDQFTSAGKKSRFIQISAGPAQALNRCVDALRRGDASVVLTSALYAERRSVLSEIGRLLGRSYGAVLRIEAAVSGRQLLELLRGKGYASTDAGAAPGPAACVEGQDADRARKLVVIDNAEMLDARILDQLSRIQVHADGSSVQFLLAGAPLLVSQMCDPESADFWRGVRMAVTLTQPEFENGTGDTKIDQLRVEIARTEAKLAAQKRMLAIFTSRSSAAVALDRDFDS